MEAYRKTRKKLIRVTPNGWTFETHVPPFVNVDRMGAMEDTVTCLSHTGQTFVETLGRAIIADAWHKHTAVVKERA